MKHCLILILSVVFVVSCNQKYKTEIDGLEAELKSLAEKSQRDIPSQMDVDVPAPVEYRVSFDKERYGVDAGSSIAVRYSVSEKSTVEVVAGKGWNAVARSLSDTEGEIVITAPDPASPADIVVKATTESGKQVAAGINVMVRDPYTDATRTDVAALAYYGFHDGIANDHNFQMLADGGFDMITIESVDDWKKQLDLCQAHGVKGVLFVNGPAGDYYRDGTSTTLTKIIDVAKNHPALVAYQIADEPSVSQIYQLSYEKNRIEELDPGHPVYINLHPGHAGNPKALYGTDTYDEYVERFVTECDLDFITFDQYPVFTGRIDPTWHMTLQVISGAARRHNIPFWAFTLCCREHGREDPTLENIRLQCNTNLAYGAQVNQFFVYRATSGTNYAPIMSDGTYTTAYDHCKAYNMEMHKRGYVFSGCNVKKIRSSGDFDIAVETLSITDLPPQLKSLYCQRDALISFIENNGNEYVVIVNGLWNMSQVVKAEVEEMIYSIDHDGLISQIDPGIAEFILDGGDMIVLKIK